MIAEVDFTAGAHDAPREGHLPRTKAEQYQVEPLDFESRKAFVRQVDPEYYTDAIVVHEGEGARSGPSPTARRRRAHGEVRVPPRSSGYKKIKFYTHENVGYGELDLPENQMHTTAFWLTVPRGGDARAAAPGDRIDAARPRASR